MKKKIWGFVLAICMLIGSLPVMAVAESGGVCGENLTWRLDNNGTLTISGTGDMRDWTSSSLPWNSTISSITDVVIEDGVTSIGDYSFSNCKKLVRVNIPPSINKVGAGAFSWCENLTYVSIPQSVREIGDYAFSFCYNLSAIDVDENNESYMSEDGVLFDKEQTSIIHYPSKRQGSSYTILNGVERIEPNTFSGSVNLETINIPDSVKYIGEFAFGSCHNLTSLIIPDGVTELSYGMAVDCEKLSSIKFPDTITRFGGSYIIDGTAYYKDESNWIDGVLYVDNCLMEAKT